MKKLYIVLSHTGTWVSRSIKLYTRSNYSHVSISFDENLRNLYSFGRKTPRNPFNGGFIQEGKNQGIYKRYKNTSCTVYEVEVEEEKYKSALELVNHFIQNEHLLKYNYLGLFTIIMGYPINRRNYYFCSQFVAEILHKAGVIHLTKNYSLMRPTDFCKEEDFKLIYQGQLAYYSACSEYETQFSKA